MKKAKFAEKDLFKPVQVELEGYGIKAIEGKNLTDISFSLHVNIEPKKRPVLLQQMLNRGSSIPNCSIWEIRQNDNSTTYKINACILKSKILVALTLIISDDKIVLKMQRVE